MRSHLAADRFGELFHPLVGNGLGHHGLDLFGPGRIGAVDQGICRGPGFLFGFPADDLQAHGELDLLAAAVLGGALTHFLDLFGDALRVIAPEQVYGGMLGGNFRCMLRTTAEEERRVRLLEGGWHDFRAVCLVVLAFVFHAFFGPQAFHQLDFLLQLLVAAFLGDDLAFGVGVLLAEAGDQVDVDTPLGQLVEGGEHLGLGDRVDEAGLHRHQGLELLGTGDHERSGHPGIPAEGRDGDQYVIKPGLFGGDGNPLEMLEGLGNAFAGIAEGSGIANGWNEPTHLQGFLVVHGVALARGEREATTPKPGQ
ncbi:hypothetical protein D9M71_416290 [compost metagenome]